MWDKPWTWNMLYCWWDYPRHHIDRGIWYYYMLELSFYWSLLITQFFDVKRKVMPCEFYIQFVVALSSGFLRDVSPPHCHYLSNGP